MVGAAGFEPATPSPPDWCANQTAPRSARQSKALLQVVVALNVSQARKDYTRQVLDDVSTTSLGETSTLSSQGLAVNVRAVDNFKHREMF